MLMKGLEFVEFWSREYVRGKAEELGETVGCQFKIEARRCEMPVCLGSE